MHAAETPTTLFFSCSRIVAYPAVSLIDAVCRIDK
jgi:hypothetical protein